MTQSFDFSVGVQRRIVVEPKTKTRMVRIFRSRRERRGRGPFWYRLMLWCSRNCPHS